MRSCSTSIEAPDVAAVVTRLRAGDVFTAITADRAEDRAKALEQVLRATTTDGTRIVWVGNPLRSPLTIERLLLQIVGPEVDLRLERTPAELAELLTRRVGQEDRLLVIVQQPETINPETEEALAAASAHLDDRPVQVQFLFAGPPSLRLPRHSPRMPTEVVAERKPLVLRSRPDPSPAAQPSPAPTHTPTHLTSGRRRDMLPVAALLSIATLGLLLSYWPSTRDPNSPPVNVRLSLGSLSAPVPDSVLSGMARMREEFDKLLADRVATLPPLTDAQKDALFDEFVTRYRGG